MLRTAELLFWIAESSRKNKFEFSFTPFPENPEIYHFTFRTTHLDPLVAGHGCSTDLSEAKLKAGVEFLERLNLRLMVKGANSNGFACHFDPEEAKKSAYNELIERDSFLWHWHNIIPPILKRTEKIADRTISYYQLQSRDKNIYVSFSLMKLEQGPYLFGLAASRREEIADRKSYLELITNYYNLQINKISPINLEDFLSLPRVPPHQHFRLSLSDQYVDFFSKWINSDSSDQIKKLTSFEVNEIAWHESLRGHGLRMFRATSLETLHFYFGKPDRQYNINPLPHPMA